MAVSVFKTWVAAEVLTAADLNSSFTQITANGEDLGWPATKAKNFNSQDATNVKDLDAVTLAVSGVSTLTGAVTLGANLIFSSGSGIDFSATSDGSGTASSELFDDYEEGTWTPILTDSTLLEDDATYAVNEGRYIKVGKLCYIFMRMDVSSLGSLTTGNDANIIGLPYTGTAEGTGPNMDQAGQMMYQLNTNLPATGDFLLGEVKDNTAYINLGIYDASATAIAPCLVSYISATGELGFSMCYETV